jgi:hypothetical protein
MQPLARLGYTAATCALLVATFAIIGPRVVHAVAATLVRDEDNPARHTFVAVCGFASTSGSTVQCDYQVPAGEEVVIQTAWVHAIASAANTSILNTVQSVSKGATPIESSVGTNNGMTASETDVQTTMSSTPLLRFRLNASSPDTMYSCDIAETARVSGVHYGSDESVTALGCSGP